MDVKQSRAALLVAVVLLSAHLVGGCDQVRGRRLVQKANQQYHQGEYAAAVATFHEAEQFLPSTWQLWLNEGTACRQLMVPGAKTPENDKAADCAMSAFTRMGQLNPQDQRGPALYLQTLFDAERFDTLATMYRERAARNPADEEAINGLVQVYSRWTGHMNDALTWYQKKADLKAADPEAQYAVGVYVWQQLFARGGGADKAAYDPRPQPGMKNAPQPPAFAPGDIVGQSRAELADAGLKYLERAVALRSSYIEAMAYLNLLYRQRSYAFLDQPAEWQKSVDKAMEWRDKAALAVGKSPAPAAQSADGI